MNRKARQYGKVPRTMKVTDIAFRVCSVFGATIEELAQVLGISVEVLEQMRANDSDLARNIRGGGVLADANVANRLYRLAVGYSQSVTKSYLLPGQTQPVVVTYEEHALPDIAAIAHWLRNRDPERWPNL